MPVDNFGRSFDTQPTMEELLSPVKENKKEDEKRHEELADVLKNMSNKFEKGMDQSKKIAQNLFDLIKKDDKKEFGQNKNLNVQFQKLALGINNNNKEVNDFVKKAELQFARGGRGGVRPAPANPPAKGKGQNDQGEGKGQNDQGGGFSGTFGNIIKKINPFLTGAQQLAKIFDDLLAPPDKLFQPISQMLDFKNAFKELNQFDIGMKRILYQTHGLTSDSEEVVKAFTQLKNVTKETGFDQTKLAGIMENYARKGMRTNTNLVKHAQTMQKIGRSQLFTERQLGLEAGTLTDHFSDLNIQANMSSLEIGTIAKSMRDVALNTGMTGRAMTEAIASSKQFSNNLMNAGNLTANSLKNVTQMTANFKKFGAERAGEQIQSYLTDSNKLLLEGGDKMAMLVRQAADIGGVSQELIDGTITKSDKSMKKFSQGFEQMLRNIGVESIEQFENLSDSTRAEINRNAQLMYGVSAGELLRAGKAIKESGKSFADRMQDIEKEGMGGGKTAKEKADLDKRKAEMKISRSLDIFGTLGKTALGPDVKSMTDVFDKFGTITKEFDQDLSVILGKNVEDLKKAKGEDVTFNLFAQTIEDLNKQLVAAGKSDQIVNIDETQLTEALKKGADVGKFREIVEEIQAGQKRLTTARLEEQDPSTAALFKIQGNVEELRNYFLGQKLQPGKALMMERKKEIKEGKETGKMLPSMVDNIVDAGSLGVKQGLLTTSKMAGLLIPGMGINEGELTREAPGFSKSAAAGGTGAAKLLMSVISSFFGYSGSGDGNNSGEEGSNEEKSFMSSIWDFMGNAGRSIGGLATDIAAPNFGFLQGAFGTEKGTWADWLASTAERVGTGALNLSPLGWLSKAGLGVRAAIGAGTGVAAGVGSGAWDWLFGGSAGNVPETIPESEITPEIQPSITGSVTDFEQELNKLIQENTAKNRSIQFSRNTDNITRNVYGRNPSEISNLLAKMNPEMDYDRAIMPLDQRSAIRMDEANSSMDSNLFATNPRMQAQIANVTTNKNQVFDYEERNSAEILKTLKQIRDDLNESRGSNSGDSSGIRLLGNKGGTKVDPKLGSINGGDYTRNDAIKAMNY